MRLADKLVELRKNKAWTQATAAKNIDIQQSYLSKLENGHFFPSDDVIEKLCTSYGVSKEYLHQARANKPQYNSYLILIFLLGTCLILIGYTGLMFPQTYYTYKTRPLGEIENNQATLNYHLSDQYHGDKYVKTFSDVEYEYVLIAEKEILKKENRWLMITGLVLLLFSVGFYIFRVNKLSRGQMT